MRRILFLFLLSVLLTVGAPPGRAATAAPPDPSAQTQQAAAGVSVKLTDGERRALEDLLTFFFRYAGTALPEDRNNEILIRLGAAAVFRHHAMEGMEACAPRNDPDREDGFLLSPPCVDAAAERLTGYVPAESRSVDELLFTKAGYSIPLPNGDPPVTAVVDKVSRLENRTYRVEGYYLRYRGAVVEENALDSSHAFTALADRSGDRWRLRALRTDARARPSEMPLHVLRAGITRDTLLFLGAVPVDDGQALWVCVATGDIQWRGRIRLRQGKAVAADLQSTSGQYEKLDAILRDSGFFSAELIRGEMRQRPSDIRKSDADTAWSSLVEHFYAALGTTDPEPAQLLYLPRAAREDNVKASATFPQVRIDRGENPHLIILWR